MIKHIWQRENGCGIACVAMISGKSLDSVETLFTKKQVKRGTSTKALANALSKLGFKSDKRLRPLRGKHPKNCLNHLAILKVDPRKSGNWHWVLWDHKRKIIMDPCVKMSPDFEMVYKNITSYMKVENAKSK